MADSLPPLQTLRAFEATARHLSMTLAGHELHLTHGAISRQIRTLEASLGTPLFVRLTRRLELTDAGRALHASVSRLLSELARDTQSIRQQHDDTRLVISTGISFASKWLAPRLHRLMSLHPGLDIHLEVTDTPIDFGSAQIDIAMRYGNGTYPGALAERIMNETVSPVCSPEYRARMGGLTSPEALQNCRLIHEIGMNITWSQWFTAMKLNRPASRGPGYSHGSMSIEAAIRGEGVALGRSVLVAEDLAAGRLVDLFPQSCLAVDWGYDLLYRAGHENHPKVSAFRTWIREEVVTEARPK